MSLIGLFRRPGPSGFGFSSTAEQVTEGLDLSGRTILITGCNSGLGKESMRVLAMRGAHVVGLARTADKASEAANDVGADITPVACDLSEPQSVRECVTKVKECERPLHAIICNAGIMALPKPVVKHGFELQFLTNHIGHFILVTGLLDSLSADGRVVMVSSSAHEQAVEGGIQFDNLDGQKNYKRWGFYGQSKLANLLFARHLATRLPSGQTANAVHPGVINTNLSRFMPFGTGIALAIAGPIGLKSAGQGAATQCLVAVHSHAKDTTGEYFYDCNVQASSEHGQDLDLAARLWERSEEIASSL